LMGKHTADNQDLVVAYLQAALLLLEYKGFATVVLGASKDVLGLIKAANVTPVTHRFSGLLAADLLVSASIKLGQSLGPVAGTCLDPLTTPKSFVTDVVLVRKSSEAEGEAHARLFENVMKKKLLKVTLNLCTLFPRSLNSYQNPLTHLSPKGRSQPCARSPLSCRASITPLECGGALCCEGCRCCYRR
jgi:hypothetical protein